ncbi:hypothetical protein P280DRAFT_475224 [Massarina eburnea CBS 473.64]|uniref:Uncharacterized protein n=1 Tax=Massarina eburnea CBS 473.64 TaxID=1395130 RepID=A0A6A6SH04_9PLEO|nr:hypothetical protein P280DRAFT_475224 [Massarina eburnea CBS 473.64]
MAGEQWQIDHRRGLGFLVTLVCAWVQVVAWAGGVNISVRAAGSVERGFMCVDSKKQSSAGRRRCRAFIHSSAGQSRMRSRLAHMETTVRMQRRGHRQLGWLFRSPWFSRTGPAAAFLAFLAFLQVAAESPTAESHGAPKRRGSSRRAEAMPRDRETVSTGGRRWTALDAERKRSAERREGSGRPVPVVMVPND